MRKQGMLFLCFFLSLSWLSHPALSEPLERLEASVNNQLILTSDIARFKATLGLRSQLDPLFSGTELSKKAGKASTQEIIRFLIDEKIITSAFPVTDAEVEQEINAIQSANKINREILKQALSAQGFKFEDYFELIRIGTSKKNLIDREIRTKVSISDDDVKNKYVNSYSKKSTLPSLYRVQIITNPLLKDIQTARAALSSGEGFNEVAKKWSRDPSATDGGDLGLLSEEQMSAPIRKQIKKMKVGQVSPILGDSKTTYFILRLEKIQKTDDSRLKALSDQIRGQLANTEYQRQLDLWLERQKDLSFIHRAGESSMAGLPKGP